MLDVYELEQKHKSLALKRLKPFILLFVSIFIMLIVLFIFFINRQSNTISQVDTSAKQEIPQIKESLVTLTIQEKEQNATMQDTQEQEQVSQPTKEQKLELHPSLDFLDKVQISTIAEKPKQPIKQTQTKQEESAKIATPNDEIVVDSNSLAVKEVEQKQAPLVKQITPDVRINILKKDGDSELEDVIKRFKNNNNPSLSLFIAKKYYQMGNFDKAYDYALATNNINNNIEDSWIIFAKSLVKLDRKDEAMQTLQKYISYSKSQAARQLLEDIKIGKFK